VNFNASGSSHPLACANIASYTMTFGDGSNPVTQASPLFTHTYNNAGDYIAKLHVTDTIGQVSTNSAQVEISVNTTIPQLTGVVSQMVHGTAGTFEVQMFPLLNGKRGVECRRSNALGAGNYTIVFGFANPLTSVTGASVTGTGSVSTSMIGVNPQEYIVNLTGVANQQYITVTLTGVHDSTGASGTIVGPQMGVLVGDVSLNGNGTVDGNDVSATQSGTRQPVTSTNFRLDVTASGLIDGNDVSLVQSQTRTSLPSSP